ncbi:MAG: hypothetical protein AAF404_14815 [Pseudomonadota bacterium]
MAQIIPFKKRKTSSKGKTLCANNHHKWKVDISQQFDVKKGELVTRYVCERCGKARVKSH